MLTAWILILMDLKSETHTELLMATVTHTSTWPLPKTLSNTLTLDKEKS